MMKKSTVPQKKSAAEEVSNKKSKEEEGKESGKTKVNVGSPDDDDSKVPVRDYTSFRGHGCTRTIVHIGGNIIVQIAPILYVNKETGLPQSWDGISIIRDLPRKQDDDDKKQKNPPRIDMPLHCIQPLARALRSLEAGMQEMKKTPPTVNELHELIQKEAKRGGDGQVVVHLTQYVKDKTLPHTKSQIHQYIRLVTHTKQFPNGAGEMISFVKDLNGFKDDDEKNKKRKFTLSFAAKYFDNFKLAVDAMAFRSQEKTVT